MRHRIKLVIILTQFVIVAVSFFFVYGSIAMILYVAGEISLAEVIESLEILVGTESLTMGAVLYKLMRGKMTFDDFLTWFFGLFDGTEDNGADAEEKIKVMELEKMKSLKRK